jgi:hypothetical protein
MKHLLPKLLLLIAPTVMMAKTPFTYSSASASFNIKALDQVFSAHPSAVNPNGSCQAVVKLTAEIDGESNCAANNLIYYHIDIDLDSDGTIDMIASSKVNQNFAKWTLDTIDQKMKCFIAPNAKGNFSFEVPQFIQVNSIKTHKVSWHIYDECGHSSKAISTFQVKDTKAPTPYCVNVSTALMQSNPQMVELWAKDFDKGAFDNCTLQSNLYFTFEGVGPILNRINEPHFYKKGASSSVNATATEYAQGKAYRWHPFLRTSAVVFTACVDYNLIISVWDEAGNTDFCTVALKFLGGCGGMDSWINIKGKVQSIDKKPIREATITFDANLVEYPKSVQTANGLYSFELLKGYEYGIIATYPKIDLYNVNQKDIKRLESHISGQKPFTHYWQYIAADVNFDKKVDIEDLKHLEKFLPTNESIWLFIQKVDSINTINWFKYTYYVEIKNPQTDVEIDFTAILIGDIDGSSAGLDVIQYDANNEIKSDENDISYKGQDLSNKGASSFEIIAQDQIFAANPSPNDPKCTGSVRLEAEIKGVSNCVSSNLIYYHIEIDLDSDSTVNMIASSLVDKSFTSWTWDEADKVQKLYVAPDAKGNYIMKLPAFALESILIHHSVTWKISDACGNVSMQEVTMVCIDKKAPEPKCISIFTKTDLGGRGREIWAKDIDNGSYDPCTPKDELIFSFDGVAPIYNKIESEHFYKRGSSGSILATENEYLMGKAYRWDPKRKSAGVFVKYGHRNINVNVWDESWNTDFATVVLIIYSTHYQRKIYGNISNVKGKSIKDAQINMLGKNIYTSHILDDTLISNKNGSFTKEVPFTYALEIGAENKSKDKFNVNKKDLEKLVKHLNGQEAFTHYWQFIAADINKDKMVDGRDLLELENLIALKSTGNWLVINHDKPLDIQNWSSYLAEYIVGKWNEEEEIKVDFTAILIGDIDGSSAGLDVIQYDSNFEISNQDETSWRNTITTSYPTFKAYPNPYSDHFYLEIMSQRDEVVKMTLMDIAGRLVHTLELDCTKGQHVFTVDDSFFQPSGLRIVRLESESGIHYLKVINLPSNP